MRSREAKDLLLLAALWGASFLFMRVAAPVFGPIALTAVRVGVAAVALLPIALLTGGLPTLRRHAGRIMLVGVLNSALPFVLFAYATLHLSAGMAAILNATVPIWTALVAWQWLGDRVGPRQWLGLALATAGVAVLVGDHAHLRAGADALEVLPGIGAALLATLCYAVAANYTRRSLGEVPALINAAGSQLGAALVLLPPSLLAWPAQVPAAPAWGAAIALGLLCTGLAYLLYFRLIARLGATGAANVTLLIPVFATLWGWLLLGEAVTLPMAAGGVIVLAGVSLALRR